MTLLKATLCFGRNRRRGPTREGKGVGLEYPTRRSHGDTPPDRVLSRRRPSLRRSATLRRRNATRGGSLEKLLQKKNVPVALNRTLVPVMVAVRKLGGTLLLRRQNV